MIRLTAAVSDHGFIFTLARDGALITTGNGAEATDVFAPRFGFSRLAGREIA